MIPHKEPVTDKSGVIHDMKEGPCSCGATHEKVGDTIIQCNSINHNFPNGSDRCVCGKLKERRDA